MTNPLFEQALKMLLPAQLKQLDRAQDSNVISFADAARQRFGKFNDRFQTSVEHVRELGGMAQKNLGQVTKTAQADLARRVQATSKSMRPMAPAQVGQDGVSYLVDAMQRWVLFIDLLRRRGNQFVEHEKAGCPPVLVFDYEMILDGRALPRPVNYALVQIVPPADWNITIDNDARPYIIIDPRAGHGAGIGGFKSDSQVGVALRAGHAVYFVIFFPDPEPGQTILDVCKSEAEFIKEIRTRHPNSDKPVIIGNCQGGWAVMMLGASNPDITGPIVMNGAPLSYWAGENGRNPMRYIGGLAGGAWPAMLLADMGNGRFDGANLVRNFESLNPANTYWSKLYNVYSHVDTEEKRFLEFERWWGGFYFMTDEEIEWIVGNLFIGNKFAGGKIEIDGHTYFDMRAIKSPIVVFASSGDHITPPQQALNWIADVYQDSREIKANGQRIVYLVHEDIGHLGIFVSAKIAKKEHKEIVESLKTIENLAPGLYEMVIEEVTGEGKDAVYSVAFQERQIDDIFSTDDGRKDEKVFESVAAMSELNEEMYRILGRPMVQLMATEAGGKLMERLHPLRCERYMFSDYNPFVAPFGHYADYVKGLRKQVESDNVFLRAEQAFSSWMEFSLNLYRDMRDTSYELAFYTTYGTLAAFNIPGSRCKHQDDDAVTAIDRLRESPEVRKALEAVEAGGYAEAVIRMLILMAKARGSVRRDRLQKSTELMTGTEPFLSLGDAGRNRIIHQQTLIADYEAEAAITTLPSLLKTADERAKAIATIKDIAGPSEEMDEATARMLAMLEQVLASPAVAPTASSAAPKAPAKRRVASRTKKPATEVSNEPVAVAAVPEAAPAATVDAETTVVEAQVAPPKADEGAV